MSTDVPSAPASNGRAELFSNRRALLAQLGEAYLVLESHQAAAQDCVQRIQQLRALLGRLDQELQAPAHPHEREVAASL